MENIEVQCPNCKKKYFTNEANTKFHGPYMISNCPKCSDAYEGKFLTFIVKQFYYDNIDERNRFDCCKKMISLAQCMDEHLNPEPIKLKAQSE